MVSAMISMTALRNSFNSSFKMNKSSMTGDQTQAKQMNMMFNIMIVMIFITSFSMSTAIIIYWVTNSLFTVIQSLIFKRIALEAQKLKPDYFKVLLTLSHWHFDIFSIYRKGTIYRKISFNKIIKCFMYHLLAKSRPVVSTGHASSLSLLFV